MIQAKQYRSAMMQLSKATNGFAAALEACARVKGAACPVSLQTAEQTSEDDELPEHQAHTGLLAFGGLANVLGSHEHILADSFYRSFEIPLLSLLDDYRAAAAERRAVFDAAIREKGSQIRRTEMEQLRRGRAKRDLADFRRALGELQRQVDELDDVKVQYYREVLEGEHELWNVVLDKTAFAMKAQLDVADKIACEWSSRTSMRRRQLTWSPAFAAKATDPSLEHLVASHEDPFGQHANSQGAEIFSVLAPLNVLASMPKSPVPDQGKMQAFGDLSMTEESKEEEEEDHDGQSQAQDTTPDAPAHHIALPGSDHQDVWDAPETDRGNEGEDSSGSL